MECAETRGLLAQRLDGLPPPRKRAACEAHLQTCAPCRDYLRALERQDVALRVQWPAITAPDEFAHRVTARLAPRRERQPTRRTTGARSRWLAGVAVLAIVLLTSAVAQPAAWAHLALALRQVVLHETVPTTPPGAVSMSRLSLEEAQRLVPWRIRQPSRLPEGYALVAVEGNTIHTFAAGPTIVLHYQKADGARVQELSLVELAATDEVSEPVGPDAARQIPVGVGGGVGLFIDGAWVEQQGRPVWERGTLVRLIVEQQDLVIQLQADPRDGWDADRLAQVADSLQ